MKIPEYADKPHRGSLGTLHPKTKNNHLLILINLIPSRLCEPRKRTGKGGEDALIDPHNLDIFFLFYPLRIHSMYRLRLVIIVIIHLSDPQNQHDHIYNSKHHLTNNSNLISRSLTTPSSSPRDIRTIRQLHLRTHGLAQIPFLHLQHRELDGSA